MVDRAIDLLAGAKGFVEACFERRDGAAMCAFVDQSAFSMCGCEGLFSLGDGQARPVLEALCRQVDAFGIHMVHHECHVAQRRDARAVTVSRIRLSMRGRARPDGRFQESECRLSLVFSLIDDSWFIEHAHVSMCEGMQGPAAGLAFLQSHTAFPGSDRVSEWERYKIVAELADDVVFDHDILADKVTLTIARFSEERGMVRECFVIEQYRRTFEERDFVHPADLERYRADRRALELQGDAPGWEERPYLLEYRLRFRGGCADFFGRTDSYVHRRIIGRRLCDAERNPVRYVGKIVDVTEEVQLVQQSQTDALTGAYNRTYLSLRLADLARAKQPDVLFAFLLVDVDCFKAVNDQLGHLMGDELLRGLVRLARSLFRESDVVARLGGDEFMVFMPDVYDPAIVDEKSAALIERFGEFARGRGAPSGVSLSVGEVVVRDVPSFEEVYRRADIALYWAKTHGKNCGARYEDGMEYPSASGPLVSKR